MSDGNWTDKVAAFGAVKKVNWKNVVLPIAVLLIVSTFAFMRMTDNTDPKEVAEETAQQVARENSAAFAETLSQYGLLPSATTVPAAAPNYDYITCTHLPPKDIGCTPLFTQPLTIEAQYLIGFQDGNPGGALNSDNTREIVNQIRTLSGVDQCALFLSIVTDERKLLRHKVFPSEAEATTGSTKLYDCTPKLAETVVTAPHS